LLDDGIDLSYPLNPAVFAEIQQLQQVTNQEEVHGENDIGSDSDPSGDNLPPEIIFRRGFLKEKFSYILPASKKQRFKLAKKSKRKKSIFDNNITPTKPPLSSPIPSKAASKSSPASYGRSRRSSSQIQPQFIPYKLEAAAEVPENRILRVRTIMFDDVKDLTASIRPSSAKVSKSVSKLEKNVQGVQQSLNVSCYVVRRNDLFYEYIYIYKIIV
jgi:hypothetical protein